MIYWYLTNPEQLSVAALQALDEAAGHRGVVVPSWTVPELWMTSKRQAAKRWVNHVNASELVDAGWRYVLLSETDIKQAKGSWPALCSLGT